LKNYSEKHDFIFFILFLPPLAPTINELYGLRDKRVRTEEFIPEQGGGEKVKKKF